MQAATAQRELETFRFPVFPFAEHGPALLARSSLGGETHPRSAGGRGAGHGGAHGDQELFDSALPKAATRSARPRRSRLLSEPGFATDVLITHVPLTNLYVPHVSIAF